MKLEKGTLRFITGAGALAALVSTAWLPAKLHLIMMALGSMSLLGFLLLHFDSTQTMLEIGTPKPKVRYQLYLLASAIGAATLLVNYIPTNMGLGLDLAGLAGALSVRPKVPNRRGAKS